MYIKKLIITNYLNDVIRDINFNDKGLNLIVGMNTGNGTSNNIGKTTLIRCIDFCLEGKFEQLYIDKEFKEQKNEEIYTFLKREQPIFKSIFTDPYTNNNYTIVRTVTFEDEKFVFNNKILLDDTEVEGDFQVELKKIFFNTLSLKPSFRQLVPKFIRKDEQQISNVLKYLHSTTSYSEYEKIHLFLFGFKAKQVLQKKSELERSLKSKKKAKTILGSRFNATDLRQILEITKKDLGKYYTKRDLFKLDDQYELEEKQLKNIQLNLIDSEKAISNIKLKHSMTLNKLKELEEGIFGNDTQALKLLYDEVSFYTENLHKTFDDVVKFHNKMISNEVEYMKKKVFEYEKELESLSSTRNGYSEEYSKLMMSLSKKGSLAEYTKLNEQIEKLVEKKGQDEKLLEELEKIEKEVKDLEDKLLVIKKEVDLNLLDFDKKLSIFNESFSNYSKILYDKEYFVSYNKEEDPIKFYTKNVGGNEGSGKKQAIVSAFDLAYIDFIDRLKLNVPHFIAHDKVELIDIAKLEKLFEISNQINGQFIIPIIYDKIEGIYDKFKGNIILKLSEENKFFGV